MKSHTSFHSLQRLIRWGVPVVLLIAGSPPGKTQIKSPTASNPVTLGTLVNGIEGGSCYSGTCAITGGKAKGNKLFHRLTEFWADSDYIDKVTVNNLQTANKPYKSVIVSNIDDYGTYLDTALEFTTSKSDLIILSPGGIKLGSEAHFTNIGSLALSTAENLVVGDEFFHFKDSTESDLINMTAVIDLAQSSFEYNQAEAGQISIEIDDTLSIDADLILHSVGGIDIKAAEGSDASLDVAGTFNLVAHGNVNDEGEISSSVEIIDTNIYANTALIEGNGSVKQPQGVLVESANIYTTDDIQITGIGGDETAEINNESLAGLVLEGAELISKNGNIVLTGEGGRGNQKISFGDYDFDFGSGLTINDSNIQTNHTNGLISLQGAGSFGSNVFTGHGIDVNGTNLFANRITASAVSAEASSDGSSNQSAGIIFDTVNANATHGITITGKSANTDPNKTDIAFSTGTVIQNSNFLASAGPIKIEGTGGSGKTLVNSTGIIIYNTDIRGSKIKLTGIGGSTNDPENSNESIGVSIYSDSSLNTRTNEDDSSQSLINGQNDSTNGDIIISGYGGSGLEDSGGVFSTANIDSTGSIHIIGEGGVGQEDIYGVALETVDDDIDNGVIKTISADSQIIIKGEGGTGTDIVDSNGVYLSDIEVYAGQGIYIKGSGGSGEALEDSTGIAVDNTDIKGSKIELLGIGGSTNDPKKSITSIGVSIYNDSTLSTRANEDESFPILIYDQNDGTNGDIIISGYAGSGLEDSGGVFSTAIIDSTGSIHIIGEGGVGQEDIYGVALETLDDNLINGIIKTISADNQITIEGHGGTGTDIVDSNGVFLSDVEIDAGKGIYIKGQAGSSVGEFSHDELLDGILIENTRITIHSAEAIADIASANEANIVLHGTPGSSEYLVEGSSGVLITNSTLATEGGIYILGDGSDSESLISIDGDGIILDNSTIEASSVLLQGHGAKPIEPGFVDINGNLVEQTSSGVEIKQTTIAIEDGGHEFDQSIIVDGVGSGGNKNVNGIDIDSSTLTSPKLISLEGKAGDVDTFIYEGRGISITDDSTLISHSVMVDGEGSTGTSTDSSSGVYIAGSSITGTSDLTFIGLGGSSDDSVGIAEAADGISLVGGSTIVSSGDIVLDGKGGDSKYESTVSDGVYVSEASITAEGDLEIYGKGGDGEIVETSNGVSIAEASISSGKALLIDGLGGDAEESVTEARGVEIFDSELASLGNLTLIGSGGLLFDYASDTNNSGDNQGIFLEDDQIIGDNINMIGDSGDGGSLITGIEMYSNNITATNTINLSGFGGAGETVLFAEGIYSVDNTISSISGSIEFEGNGGSANLVEEGHGIISRFDVITLSDDQSLTVKGKGAEAENQLDSLDNTGITLWGTSIEGGRALDFVGKGGDGGKNNTGIEFRDASVTSDGMIHLNGTGGEGTNIKKAIGVILGQDADEMIDDQIMGKLVGGSIFITGKGGTSNLVRNALDQNGKDTFGKTANNVGVVINQYELDANTGSLSVTGSGGELVVHKNKSEDQKISPNEESTAFKLEGLTIKASKTTSSQETFLKGSGGKPISGSKNSGTTITNSTIRSATSTDILPGPAVDLDIEDVNGIGLNNATENIERLENRIEGIAFSGTNEIYGLTIDNTKIESENRSLTLSGKGGLKATGEKNYGIYIHNGSSITVGSKNNSHDLKIYGAGGDGTDMTGGILTSNTSYTGFGKINMVGKSLGSSGQLSDAIEIFEKTSVKSEEDTTFSGNNNVNVSNSSIETGGDLNFSAKKDLNIDNSKISTDKDLNATAGNDINIDNSKIDSEGDVNVTAGNDINIDNSKIDSEEDVNATADNDITVADSEINSNNTSLKADTIEIKETSLTSDQNLEIIAISGLDITSSELDASDAIALNSYSVAIESSTVKTSNLEVSSTELIQKDSSFEANSFTVNDDQSSDNDGNASVQSLGLSINTSLQTVDSQANNSEPTQSNSELTMSLAGGVNYILDDSAQESSSNDSQSSTNTSSSENTTSPSTESDESSSVDNESISSDRSTDSESESEQAKSGGGDDQEDKDDAEVSSKDQKTTKGSETSLPSQKLSIKQAKQIHKESEAQSSKFVAKQLGLPEQPAMSIQEIQVMLSNGMDSMNNNRQ